MRAMSAQAARSHHQAQTAPAGLLVTANRLSAKVAARCPCVRGLYGQNGGLQQSPALHCVPHAGPRDQ